MSSVVFRYYHSLMIIFVKEFHIQSYIDIIICLLFKNSTVSSNYNHNNRLASYIIIADRAGAELPECAVHVSRSRPGNARPGPGMSSQCIRQ